jgi:hypothetical protein
METLLRTGFYWPAASAEAGVSIWALRDWWKITAPRLIDPVDLALGHRLIQANYKFSPPQLFDGLMTCSCGRRMVRPERREYRTPHRWACPVCRLPSGKRDWVQATTVKRAVFEALQRRLPELARLCMHRTPVQRERERQWVEQLEQFVAMSRRLHEAGLPRMASMPARVQLARDQLGEPQDLQRHNWGRTFSTWEAWQGATSHQWRIVSVYFCRRVVWDGQKLSVQLFGRRFVDPLLMDPQQDPVDAALWPVHPLPPSHPAHRLPVEVMPPAPSDNQQQCRRS